MVIFLPNEITGCSINEVTDILREPGDLHVVRKDGIQNRGSERQPARFINKAVFQRNQVCIFSMIKLKSFFFALPLKRVRYHIHDI